MPDAMILPEFQSELRALLNRYNLDDECSTPDFMLAGMLTEHLMAYRTVMQANIKWHSPTAIGKVGKAV